MAIMHSELVTGYHSSTVAERVPGYWSALLSCFLELWLEDGRTMLISPRCVMWEGVLTAGRETRG